MGLFWDVEGIATGRVGRGAKDGVLALDGEDGREFRGWGFWDALLRWVLQTGILLLRSVCCGGKFRGDLSGSFSGGGGPGSLFLAILKCWTGRVGWGVTRVG